MDRSDVKDLEIIYSLLCESNYEIALEYIRKLLNKARKVCLQNEKEK